MGTYTLEDQATSKKTFGENLSIIMHERHISQAKMARELNIPKTTISTWMNDRRIPRSSAIALLCRYLQCTRKDLLDGPEETIPVKAILADSSVSGNALEGQEYFRKIFGENLSDIMYERHISQTKMANELKIPKTTISGWMNGKRIPHTASIEKVCKYLNCSQADLFKTGKLGNAISENNGDKTNTFNLSSEAMIADKIAGSYDLRSLFDAAIVSRPEDIRLVTETLRRMNRDMP